MANSQLLLRFCWILILFAANSGIVHADRVSGTVRPIPDDHQFEIKDSTGNTVKTVAVSKSGKFTVFLKPGLYVAESNGKTTTIRSEAIPLTNLTIEFKN